MTTAEKFTVQYLIFTLFYVISRAFMCCASRFILGGTLMGWIFTAGYLITLVIAGYRSVKNTKIQSSAL